MSYDLEVGVKVAGTDNLYARIAEPEYHSPTYNLGRMFRACTGWDFTQSEWYKCSEVLPKIEHGIRELHTNRKEYEKYNAPNGWGTVDSAIRDLESLRDCIYEQAEYIPIEYLYVRW